VYLKDSSLFAASIDTQRLELTGGALPVVDGVLERSGVAQVAIADNGTLVMIPGGLPLARPLRTLVWVDRLGKEEPLSARPRAYHHLRLSPDGKQVAVEIRDEEHDIWIWDLEREALTRLTTGPTSEGYPVWTPDGRHILYRSDNESGTTVFLRAADGTGNAVKLIHDREDASPQSLSRDGKQLIYRGATDKTARDLMLLPIDPPGPARPLIQTEFTEDNGQVSPDGRWIAYETNDSGQRQVFVRPFPDVDTAKVPVSSGGGSFAKWSRDGRELFYVGVVDGRQTLVSSSVPVVAAGAKFTSGKARTLFSMSTYLIGATQTYDVALDGRRLLMIKEPVETPPPPPSITVVTHWFEELRERVKGK
jgi:serine/threonine-protein kinase